MPNDLSLLTCGNPIAPAPSGSAEIGEILTYIQSMIDAVLNQLSWLATQDQQRISMLAPFLGRSLLELSITALIGRLDPLRLLVIRQVQSQPDYDTALVWKASIRWQGDVVAEKKKDLWGQSLEYDKITKALLGEYYDHLIWRPAFQRMLSLSPSGGDWVAQLAGIDVGSFVARKREELGRLYSSLSKGIHHEFVMPPSSVYDRTTIVDLVQRTVHSIADLALVSQFIPHALSTLPRNDAVATYNRIESMEVIR